MRRVPTRVRRYLIFGPLSALLLFGPVSSALAASALPLTTTDNRGVDGTITVETGEWRLVFSDQFNGGPSEWYDLAFPGGASDNLATESAGGNYSNGSIFDYDVYLGTNATNLIVYMTTMGRNASPGSLVFDLVETSAARTVIRQEGHPRLNNGAGFFLRIPSPSSRSSARPRSGRFTRPGRSTSTFSRS